MNTTRKYPRTLDEAFPGDARYAFAVERVANRASAFWVVLAACTIGVSLALAVVL